LILQCQIEKRRKRHKRLNADIRLSCQMPGVRACRPVKHPSRNFKPSIRLRPIERAAKNDFNLVDGLMNADSATKPGMMPIKNLTKNGLVGVLKPCCTITSERIGHWTKMRRQLVRFNGPDASNRSPFSADSITTYARI
jgi:hypothetical protein